MKNEISKIVQVQQEMHQEREEQKLNIKKHVRTITAQEQNLLHLRKSYEVALKGRNERWD